jgi:hypothetical protein
VVQLNYHQPEIKQVLQKRYIMTTPTLDKRRIPDLEGVAPKSGTAWIRRSMSIGLVMNGIEVYRDNTNAR